MSENSTLHTRRHKAIGGLWNSKTLGGDDCMSGDITLPDGTKLILKVWRNTYKSEGDKRPDFKIWTPEPEPVDDGFPKDDPF